MVDDDNSILQQSYAIDRESVSSHNEHMIATDHTSECRATVRRNSETAREIGTNSSLTLVADCTEQDPIFRVTDGINNDKAIRSKTRKRKGNAHLWRAATAKNARATGLAYKKRNGEMAEAKVPALTEILCRAKCRRKCSEKVMTNERQQIFDRFHAMDVNCKNNYLFQCITSHPPIMLCLDAKRQTNVI